MAYFANGSEGAILDSQCCECLHKGDDLTMCPVAHVQMQYNYEQTGNKKLRSAMNMLIDEHGICRMKKAMESAGLLQEEQEDTRSDLEIWEEARRK